MNIQMPTWLAVVVCLAFLGSGIQLGMWLVRFTRWAWSTIEEPKWWRVLLACIGMGVAANCVVHWVYGKSDPLFMFVWGFNTSLLICGLLQLWPKETKMCSRYDHDTGPCVKDAGHPGEHNDGHGRSWRDKV